MYRSTTGLEVEGRRRHVEPPDSCSRRASRPYRRVPVRLQVGHPRAEREAVVLAQALDVTNLEPDVLHDRDDRADLVEFAVGEHVTIDEAVSLEAGPGTGAAATRRE